MTTVSQALIPCNIFDDKGNVSMLGNVRTLGAKAVTSELRSEQITKPPEKINPQAVQFPFVK